MKKFDICDGITLNYIEDKKFKTTTVFVAVHTKLCREDVTKNALLPLVLKRGSKNYPTFDEIERHMARLFGATLTCSVTKHGEDQIIYFSAAAISDKYAPDGSEILKQTSNLLLEIVFNPHLVDGAFSNEYTEAEKINLADTIKAAVNDKQSYALQRLYEEMCGGEAFGIHEMGILQDVDKIDCKSLYEHYKSLMKSAAIDIFVCGEADIEAFRESLCEQLENVERTACAGYPKTTLHSPRSEVKKTVEEFEANQAKLSLGFSYDIDPASDERFSLSVANSIFGSGTHSKLFNNVREKLSLAYYAFSRITATKGVMLVGMGIEEKNYDKAFEETLLQLENLKNGEVSDEEYNSAIAYLTNNTRSYTDSQFAMIMFYLFGKIDGAEMSIDEQVAKIEAVTKQAAIDAFKSVKLDTIYFLKGKEN